MPGKIRFYLDEHVPRAVVQGSNLKDVPEKGTLTACLHAHTPLRLLLDDQIQIPDQCDSPPDATNISYEAAKNRAEQYAKIGKGVPP